MKEEDRYRHLSPLVKQDLNMLDADAETRRLAVKSLKLMVKQLDASTLPRFIFQISESHEPGATRSYVIYVYEEIGRVHGKLIVPHIPKIMGFIVRSSSAIGSCHVLQDACAKVTASLALCGIDSSTSQEDAEEIMREICTPLIDALAGKLDAVASCAASCIHALVETDKWKYAREEMVHKVCHRTFVALGEKPTRTAAHLQLICSLASANPDIISSHGGSLLRAAEEILKVTANPWQLRKAAAQLLLSVLTILDKDKLQRELNSAINVLDSCRLDKMQQVRTAVSDALHAARILASGNNVYHPALDMAASPIQKSKERGDLSPRSAEKIPISPLYKQGSGPRAPTHPGEVVALSPVSRPVDSPQALTDPNTVGLFSPGIATASPGAESPTSQKSLHEPYSPTSTSLESVEVPSPAQSEDASKEPGSPHHPPQDMANVHSPQSATTSGTSPSSSITAVEECESPSRRLSAEFNVRSQSGGVSCTSLEGDDVGNDDHSFQPEVPLTSDPSISLPSTQQNMLGVEVQKIIETQDLKDVDIITSKLPEHLRETSNEKYDPRTFIRCLLNAIDGSTPMMRISSMNVHLVVPSNAGERSKNEDGNDTFSESAEVEKREILNSNPPICIQNSTVAEVEDDAGNSNGEGCASHEQLKLLDHHDNALDHAGVDAENEKTRPLNEAKDLLPFVTPTELVLSPSSPSIPDSRESVPEQDTNLLQDEPLLSTELPTNNVDAPELGGETSSEASWSVRDNPIASEGSFRIENSGEETDAHRKSAQDSFPKVHKVGSPDSWSPREIHMILPASEAHLSVDDDASLNTSNPVNNSNRACCPMTDDADHQLSPSSVLAEQSPTSSMPRISTQAIKDMHGGPNGLSSLLHEDEKSQVSELKATGHCDDAVVRKKSDCTALSSKKHFRRHEKDGKGLRIRIRVIAHGWRKLRSCTETALRGSLCVAIALPLAVIVAKAFNGSRDGRLVPT